MPDPLIARSARSGRRIRFPKRFDDFLPGSATPLSHIPSKQRPLHTQPDPELVPPPAPPEPVPPLVPAPDPVFDTKPNEFGLFRQYKRHLTHDPEPENSLDKVCDSAAFPKANPAPPQNAAPAEPWYAPFTNAVAVIMMCWQHTKSATKSASEMDRLAHSLGDSMWDSFNIKDFTTFNTARENERIDSYIADPSSPFNEGEGWHQSSVKIRLPTDKVKTPEDQAPEFEVKGVWHHNIVNIIKTVMDATQHRAIQDAFAWSVRNIFIMYTCIAGVTVVASIFIKHKQMSTEHSETKTGIANLTKREESQT